MRLPAGESCELRPVMTPTKCRSVLPLMRGEQWVAGSRGGGDVKREGKREKEGRERKRGEDWRPERGVSGDG